MPNEYAATPIQRADFSVWLDVRKGLKETPEYRGRNTIIPGAAGEIPRSKVADRLEIELYGWIRGATWSAYWTDVKALLALFDPADGERTLSVPLDDGTTATIEAAALNVIPEGDEAISATQYFSVLLEAVSSPFWTFT